MRKLKRFFGILFQRINVYRLPIQLCVNNVPYWSFCNAGIVSDGYRTKLQAIKASLKAIIKASFDSIKEPL